MFDGTFPIVRLQRAIDPPFRHLDDDWHVGDDGHIVCRSLRPGGRFRGMLFILLELVPLREELKIFDQKFMLLKCTHRIANHRSLIESVTLSLSSEITPF